MSNLQINVTENGTTTLATKDKLCRENIDVNVDVETFQETLDDLLDGSLKTIDNPRVTKLRVRAFYGSSITSAKFDNVVSVSDAVFISCKSLVKVEFGSLKSTSLSLFNNADALRVLIIRTPTVCSLTSSAISDSGIATNDSSRIYVADELVDQYKVATNWATYADKIYPVSEWDAQQ